MYCPKCAAQNGDDARFCRVCGANLSLIPQALTGQLPANDDSSLPVGRKQRRSPSLHRAISSMFMGFAFAIVALAVTISGERWGIFLLIPAFSMLGSGVAMYVSLKSQAPLRQQAFEQPRRPALRQPTTGELTPPPSSSLVAPPPSVTEGTTRILDHSAESSE